MQSSAVNVLQGLAVSKVKEIADSFSSQKDAKGNPIPNGASESVRTALQALTACAGSAAGGSGNCSGAAMGAAASVVLNNLLKSGETPAVDAAGNPLPLADQQARDNLVATIVGAVAQAAGLNTASAVASAQIETQNNSERTPDGKLVERKTREIPAGYSLTDLYRKNAEFQALLDGLADKAGLTTNQLIDNYNAWSACIGTKDCAVTRNEFYEAFGQLYGAYIDAGLKQDRFDSAMCAGDTPLICGIQKSNAFLNSPDGTRLKGAMEAVTGGAAVFFSITGGAASCAETVGAGCVAAVAGAAAGADQAVTGARKLFTGKEVVSLGVEGLILAGMTRENAELTYAAATVGIAAAEGGAALISKLGKGGSAVAAERAAVLDGVKVPNLGGQDAFGASPETGESSYAGINLALGLTTDHVNIPIGQSGGTSLYALRYLSGLAKDAPVAAETAAPAGQSLILRPVEIEFPANGLSPSQQALFSAHLSEQEMALNRLSLFNPDDLALNLQNYENVAPQIARARSLARVYLPGSGEGLDAAHALDSVAGGYVNEFAGFRDPIQQRIGALWRTRASQIVPGREHMLTPRFDK